MAPGGISTSRLHLRALAPKDGPFVSTLTGCPEVRRYLGGPVPVHQQSEVFDSYLPRGRDRKTWLVSDDQSAIGLVFLAPHQDRSGPELSFMFHSESWGHGYGAEACKAVLRPVTDPILAETQTANAAARALLGKLEFIETERFMRFGAEQGLWRREGT